MKKATITLICMIAFLSKSFSQISNHQPGDSLVIKLTCLKGGKVKGQQLLKIYYKDSTAAISLYDKYKVTVVPKEGLDEEKMAIAEMLIKTKDTSQLPGQYRNYLSASATDSLSILKLSESYGSEQSLQQRQSSTIDCLQKSKEWLLKKANEESGKKGKKRTRIEFKESGKTDNVYFLDGYLNTRKVFKCLLN